MKIILLMAAILLIMGLAQAATLKVCPTGCDYKSIQSAVFAAKPGDTVEVHSGTYNESVILTKDINFTGVDTGIGEAVVNGGLYKNGFNSSLRGFSFQALNDSLPKSNDMILNTTLYWEQNASEIGAKSPSKGMAIINKVLKANQNDAFAWLVKALILDDSQRYDEAIDAYNESTKLDPYYYITWRDLGLDLANLKRYNEAIKAYDMSNVQHTSKFSWVDKGNALYQLGKYNESSQAYNKAIDIDPEYSLAWYNKGIALNKFNRTADADAAFAKAKELGYTG
jgi:tetratricopeptide (TPR) repeat protein